MPQDFNREYRAGALWCCYLTRGSGIWNLENMVSALGALTLALFTRPENEGGLGWTREEAEVLLAGVRKDLKNTSIHAYWQM